ncbi:MAG: GNAT family N-acetyltransferase [Armatimonadetes bacterium]|nr:GNAT family N-acetyltransferase [Armatimonadota bacterium]
MPDDAEAVCRVANAHDSEPLSPSELVRLWNTWSPTDPRQRFVVESDGAIVGVAHCRRRADMLPGLFFLNLFVNDDQAGQGIGTALVRVSEDFARESGGEKMLAFVPDHHPRGKRFAQSRGYSLSRTMFESVLDASAMPAGLIEQMVAKAESNGVRFTSLQELGDTEENRRRFYAVMHECDEDEPATQDVGRLSWEDHARQTYDSPWYRPNGAIVALVGEDWAGVHAIGPLDDSEVADMTTDFTGVRRQWRGLGIAQGLKAKGVLFARALGRSRIVTHNDSLNQPMLAVNQRLGFVARPGWLFMTKHLGVID